MNTTHPVFADIVQRLAEPAEVQTYRAALKRHDWLYNYSDDYTSWKAGAAERDALEAMRKRLDPDYAIWNQHAPSEFKRVPA